MLAKVRNLVFALMLCLGGGLLLLSCTSADKKACMENDDLQACNRECAREDKEACAKAELLKAKQQKK